MKFSENYGDRNSILTRTILSVSKSPLFHTARRKDCNTGGISLKNEHWWTPFHESRHSATTLRVLYFQIVGDHVTVCERPFGKYFA